MLQRTFVVLFTIAASAIALAFALVAAVVVLTAGLAAWAWMRWRGERPVPGEAQRGVVIEGEYRRL